MGRIVTTVDIRNTTEPRFSKKLDALVDTGASLLTLPSAWKEQFGAFEAEEVIELQTATQESIKGTVCGPARITVEGFRPVHNEVLFIDMEPQDGTYEPLLGYIALEQCGAAVDLIGHRLVPVRYMDVKTMRGRTGAARRDTHSLPAARDIAETSPEQTACTRRSPSSRSARSRTR